MQTLTRKEEQIMQAVWQIGHPCLISEILKKELKNLPKENMIEKVNKNAMEVPHNA